MSHHGVFAGGHVDCGGGAIGDLLWWLVFLFCRIKVHQLLFVCDDSGVIFDEDAVSFFCLLCSCPGGWGSSSTAVEDLSALAAEAEEGLLLSISLCLKWRCRAPCGWLWRGSFASFMFSMCSLVVDLQYGGGCW